MLNLYGEKLMNNFFNNTPLISIIVPVYNTENYLKDCIESILQQSYKNIEIILVNDGSTDSSPKICNDYSNMDNRIFVLHKENSGVSAARNSGIAVSRGEWITFIDSDDIVSENYIQTLANMLKDNKCLPCVGTATFREKIPNEPLNSTTAREIHSFKEYLNYHNGYPVAALYNSEIIKDNNLQFDMSMDYVEDVLWNSIYFYYIDKAIFLSEKIYYYRKHNFSATNKCSDKLWLVKNWINCRNLSIEWFIKNNINEKYVYRLKEHVRNCNNNIFSELVKGKLSFFKYNFVKNHAFNIKPEKKIIKYFGLEYLLSKYFSFLYFNAYKLAIKLYFKLKNKN